MPQPIDTIVNVNINPQAARVTQAGFGLPLILGVNATGWTTLERRYGSIDEVGDDFLSTTDEYKAALAIFQQQPSVSSLLIGKRGTQVAMVQEIVFDAALVTGNLIDGEIGGVAITQVPFNTDNATTLADIATQIQLSPLVVTAVSDGIDTITVTAQTAGIPSTATNFIVTGGASQANVTITTTTANHGIQEDISDIREENDDWYGLILTDRTQAVVELCAEYIEATKKIFITATDDADVIDGASTTDVAYVFEANGYRRSAVFYSADVANFPDAAWMGRCFPFSPGSETWKFKTLVGIIADSLTSNEISVLQQKQANYYHQVGGVDITAEGVMAAGAPFFIDFIRATDWQEARIAEGVYQQLVDLPKIPYTDAGIAIVENKIREALHAGEAAGVVALDPPFTVFVPRAVDVPEIDRKNRVLNQVNFSYRSAGAIHFVNINGTVSF